MKLPRKFYIPKGSVKVSDKRSDAIAYIYTSGYGKPAAALFLGKQSKPASQHYYSSEAKRAEGIAQAFANYQTHKKRVAESRQTPSRSATRNKAIKALLESTYGRGKVTVTGSRGTAHGWVTVNIAAPPPGGEHSRRDVVQLLLAAGIDIDHYDSADYGSGYQIHVNFTG